MRLKKKTNYRIQSDDTFVLSVLSEGLSFAQVRRFLNKNNITTCSKNAFFDKMKKMISKLLKWLMNLV